MYVRHTQTLSKAAHRSQQHCRMDGICHHLTRVANNSTLRSEAKVTEPHHQAEPIAAWHAPTGAPWLAATMIIQTCTSNTIRCRETATLLCFKIMLSIASHWALRRSKQLKAHQHFGMSSCSPQLKSDPCGYPGHLDHQARMLQGRVQLSELQPA